MKKTLTQGMHRAVRRFTSTCTRCSALARMAMVLPGLLLAGQALALSNVQVTSFSDSPDPVAATGTLTYSIQVENGGDQIANAVQVVTDIPAGTTYLGNTATAGACAVQGTQLVCNFGNLKDTVQGGGSPISYNITLRVTAVGGSSLSSTTTVSSASPDANNSNNSLTQSSTVSQGADLGVTPGGSSTAVGGGPVSYTADVVNNGPDVVTDPRIKYTLPSGVSYVGFSGGGWACSAAGQLVTCTRSNAATTYPQLVINGKVTGAASGTVTATVTVDSASGTPDGFPANNTATFNTIVSPGTDLSMSKTVSSPQVSGGVVTFTLTPNNIGPVVATNVRITDAMPAGYVITSVSGANWACGTSTSTSVTCTRASYAVGATDPVTVVTTAPNVSSPTALTNTASIASDTPDANSANNSSSVPTNVQPQQSDLSLAKVKTPNPVAVGSNMTSNITVVNHGPSARQGPIVVIDNLAADESYVATGTGGTNWSCSAAGQAVTCTYSQDLANGQTAPNLSIITRANAAGTLANTAAVQPSGLCTTQPSQCDLNTVNDSGEAHVVATSTAADLAITKTLPDGADVELQPTDNSLTYRLTITNNGPNDTTGVVVHDTLQAYFSSATGLNATSTIPGMSCSFSGNAMTCSGGSLANGASGVVDVTLTRPLKDGTSIANTATVTSTDIGDPDASNNSASITSQIDPVADVETVSKTVSPTSVKAGVNAIYVVTVRNNGPSSAANVAVADTFSLQAGDSGFTFISAVASNGGTCSGLSANTSYTAPPQMNCTWPATVALNSARTVTITIRPNFMSNAPTPRTISNSATSSSSTFDGTTANQIKTVDLDVMPAAVDMLVNVTDSPASSAGPDPLGFDSTTPANNVILYKVTVTNTGPSFATGVVVSNSYTPPAGASFTFLCDKNAAGDACAPGICDNTGSGFTNGTAATISCPVPTGMAAGASYTRYLAFQINSAPGLGGDVYVEHPVVTRNEPDTNAGNDFANETTTVRNRADVRISKTPSQAAVSINQPFTWTLVATNGGPGISLLTNVADTLPANMEFIAPAPTTTQGSCSIVGTALTCALGQMAPNATASITAAVRQTAYPAGGTVSNTATITTSEVDTNQSNNTTTATVNVLRSSVAGSVYFDKAGNGVRDAGIDPAIAGVILKLSGSDAYGNAVSLSTTTDASGNYSFTNLSPASAAGYTLTETQPGGYVSVLNAAGTAGGTVNGDVISAVALVANQAATGYLFGETQVTGLNGTVYVDANANNSKDSGEAGIAGVTVTLSGTSNAHVAVNCSTLTDGNGNYVFPATGVTGACANLTPGIYTVTETQPIAFNDHGETAGSAGGNTSVPNTISNVPLTAGQQASGYLFGETGTGLSGQVYVDLNNNGVRDGTEPPIKNVTVKLDGTDALGHPVHVSTTTDASGQYAFLSVPGADASGYTLTETQPATWGEGQTTAGTLGGTVNGDVISAIPLGATQFGGSYNFGEVGGSLAGHVYLDSNNNGVMDANEAPLPGVVVTLTGLADDGITPVTATATADSTGAYSFSNLPRPSAAGYTLTETQPVNYGDGKSSAGSVGGNSGVNTITGVSLPAGGHGTAYNFGDTLAATATVAGKVWIDYDHNRDETIARTGSGQPSWSVELLHNGKVAQTIITDAQGNYAFTNVLPSIVPGDDYGVVFLSPKGYVFGTPVSPDPKGQLDFSQHSSPRSQREQSGAITGLYLGAGADVPQQSLPLDPTGLVYDSIRRVPVAGASVRIDGPAGFDPATQLVGGAGSQTQTTDASGIYGFLLQQSAPAGVYTLTVTSPAGYTPGASAMVPVCANTLNVLSLPKPALVQAAESAPLLGATAHNPQACPATSAGLVNGQGSTQYYLSFNFTPGASANLVNNHIPVDPILSGALVVRKTTPSTNVQIGDLVPYTITAQNTLAARLVDVDVRDQVPPGFKYRSGSASIDGVRVEPTVTGRALTFKNQTFEVGQTRSYKLMLIVGTGVNEGEYVNQAWALNDIVNTQISNVGTATVRVVPDPLFDCPDIIGKVFDDQNANGYQDDGEPGIAAVRLVTPRGLIVTTDAQGRFHVPCPDIPDQDIGTNYVMKLDERTLPSGFRLTTENPRDVRLTRGKLVKLNFGATIHRVVRVELTDAAFVDGSTELAPAFKASWQQLLPQLQPHPSILRLAYRHASASPQLVRQRLDALHQDMASRWHALKDVYPLQIEEEQMEVAQ